MDELKPCPFCGKKPALEHNGIDKCRNSENGDLITRWKVICNNCGAFKDGGITEYIFTKDETLKIKEPQFHNGRQNAIEAWNRRAEDEA